MWYLKTTQKHATPGICWPKKGGYVCTDTCSFRQQAIQALCPGISHNHSYIPEEYLLPVGQAIVHHLLLVKAVLYDIHIFLIADPFQQGGPVSAGGNNPQLPPLVLSVLQHTSSGPCFCLEGVAIDVGLIGGGDGGLEDTWSLCHGVIVDDPED